MVCMPVIGVRLAYLVRSKHVVSCNLPNVYPRPARVTPAYRWWYSWKYYKF